MAVSSLGSNCDAVELCRAPTPSIRVPATAGQAVVGALVDVCGSTGLLVHGLYQTAFNAPD